MLVHGLAAWLTGHPVASGLPNACSPHLGGVGQEGIWLCKPPNGVQVAVPWPLARLGVEKG